MTRTYQPRMIDGAPNPKYVDKHLKHNKFKHGEFVAWDGEGWEIKGRHEYTMLMNSTGSHIIDTQGLSTSACLAFLCGEARKHSNAIHVMFASGYDVNMMLRDVSTKQLAELWETGSVKWDRYKLFYTPRKCLGIWQYESRGRFLYNKHTEKWEPRSRYSMLLWDVFGFFQGSFVSALKEYLPNLDPDTLASIIAHKQDRSIFSHDQLDSIREYCLSEVLLLKDMMDQLRTSMTVAHLPVTRWDGAGAVAASLLKRERVQASMPLQSSPEGLERAWRAYAGGRIECVRYGHCGASVWHGDINSAYPTAIRNLPDLSDGYWQEVGSLTWEPNTFALWEIEWNYDTAPFYPFFYRNPDGCIRFPQTGSGIYWTPEVQAALDTFNNSEMRGPITLKRGWIWRSKSTHKPFAFIDAIYQQRQQYKREGNAAQKVLKLGMNSMYGKMAQQVGYKGTKKPAYQCIEWAGYITSYTRAQLYRTAMQHPHDVIMFTTDGLFSTTNHQVDEGKGLGQWEIQNHEAATIVQSGVYWTKDYDSEYREFCRGFDRHTLSRQNILTSWSNLRTCIELPSQRFITMGYCINTGNWQQWRQWPTSTRVLNIDPHGTKRQDTEKWTKKNNPGNRLFSTRAVHNHWWDCGVSSAPYKKDPEEAELKRVLREQEEMIR